MESGEQGGELGARTRRGLRVTLMAQGLVQLGSILTTALLARLLSPSDFGVVALAQSVVSAALLVNVAAISTAIVSAKGELGSRADTYFWLTFGIGFAGMGLLASTATPVSITLGAPVAAPYLLALAFSFPLTLMSTVPNALMQRSMSFASLNARLLISAIAYFVVEIALALAGYGAWAVIAGLLTQALIGLILALLGARWLPRFTFSWSEIEQELPLLGGLTTNSILDYLYKNIDYWSASRFLGPGGLGVYYIAFVLPNIVRLRITAAFRSVLLPVFSLKTDEVTGNTLWVRSTSVMLSLGFPVLVGIAAVSDPLVQVFFGGKWADAAIPMQWLTLACIFDLHIYAVGTLAMARRRVGAHTLAILVRVILTATLLVGALSVYGTLTAMAIAVTTSALVTLAVQEALLSRALGVGLRSLDRSVFASAALSGVMWLIVQGSLWASDSIFDDSLLGHSVRLAMGVTVGAAAYLGLGRLLAPRTVQVTLNELKRLARGR